MAKVLIIGAGGVGGVVVHKCAQVPEIFSEIILASRTLSRCERIQKQLTRSIQIAHVDADKIEQVVALINKCKPDLVINVALPFQDLTIMEACLQTGVNYLDTANYEPPDEAKFCYKWQWDYHERFKSKGIMALLGSGFDPGATNVFSAYAQKHYFDEIHAIDIIDCNAGSHGHAFATNFNPEINIREITQRGKYWEKGQWVETAPLSVHMMFDYPEIGPRKSYLMYHEELESLVKHIKGLKRIRFWMTFSDAYINYLNVLQNVGMTRIDPVMYEGKKIVPLQFLKAVLPDPASLGISYTGKTNIGCFFEGEKNGQKKRLHIYNVCDHAECYKEVMAQAVSYTTGVPAMIGAIMMLTNAWRGKGVFNMEQFDPDPFMERMNMHGLPWVAKEVPEYLPTLYD
ncbi:MAG: saccharopine dehydrogenase [Candidatus Raymondbacteria bacterium RifOxyA12_full_50_37]|uniref:Saccharopine dehydrogenase n=1 Tax=Candidatus Raymondbacteria bacterium RIFOXYD12_FULL_49_13 TaxID=1817890 RepID=A0A1F7FFI3_UNCRA|nr:MAG: saccharopine dehydrogenase [Candidatus Raymondbacteria bacterium RifOxyA12_full_50_37]OGJ92848.1 MAG: saccharopine dehydrogenase [Candidatus Raymondbacteria bacterium RIFOXYA2_FULL_49_16]OGJ94125.1 MAG: saccharopine dehydrogenase [Candidatus Raymondbacteria bacterium RifOxyC12_full_50_8]OGJ99140.1 MAG: saccharopine dehydrogenase [Candidatus Raymondbacteria bacterium RIFOXYC2_FULL_50_21]OGK01614.1 MAG: saccharopine dehydrogenase [Candidatus Raymondbacteria bacterium RifOxyB12_full_50_8]